MSDDKTIALLEGVLNKTEDLIKGYQEGDYSSAVTPCEEYTAEQLVNHIIGWLQVFEAGANNEDFTGDAAAFQAGDDPAAEFAASSARLVRGWAEHGIDRPVKTTGAEMPGPMVMGMTVMEYVAHGWDLARATAQNSPYQDDEVTFALETGRQILPPEYRGEGQPFAPVLDVSADAPLTDQFVGFMGRNPAWSA